MKTVNNTKLEKYVPVRKQLKAVKRVTISRKQAANDGLNNGKPALPEAA